MCLTVWWRTITLDRDVTKDKPEFKHLGTYLENTHLVNKDRKKKHVERYAKPYEKGEWHAMIGPLDDLQDLCTNLDKRKKEGEEWWINNFDDVDKLDKFLREQEVFKKEN